MNIRSSLLLLSFTISYNLVAADPTFELVNDTGKKIYIAMGNEENDPGKFKFDPVTPSDVIPQYIDLKKTTLMFIADQLPQDKVTRILSVKFSPKKKIFIAVTDSYTVGGSGGVKLKVKPQVKNSEKSSFLSAKNDRGLSLSGNVTSSDIKQDVIYYDASKLSKEFRENQQQLKAAMNQAKIDKQRAEDERVKKLAQDKRLEEESRRKELEEKARLEKIRKEADLKQREEESAQEELRHLKQKEMIERAKLEVMAREEAELKRLKAIEIEKQNKFEQERRLADQAAAREKQRVIDLEARRLQEEKLKVEKELENTKRLEELKQREEKLAQGRGEAWKQKLEEDRKYKEEIDKNTEREIEEWKKRFNEQLAKIKSESDAKQQAAIAEELKKIEAIKADVRKLNPKTVYLEVMLKKLPDNATDFDILGIINIEAVRVSQNPSAGLSTAYSSRVKEVQKWLNSEKEIHRGNIIGITRAEEKAKVVEEMLAEAYNKAQNQLLIKDVPSFDRYSVFGLSKPVDPKKDFLEILGIRVENPTFGDLLMSRFSRANLIENAVAEQKISTREVIFAKTLLIDAYEAAVNWLAKLRNSKNPYIILGLGSSSHYAQTPAQILTLDIDYSSSDVDKAYSFYKGSIYSMPPDDMKVAEELLDMAATLAKINLNRKKN